MSEKTDREDRLKQALRANLRRRKDQARQRKGGGRDGDETPDEAPEER